LNHVFYLITHNNNTDLVPYLDLPWEVIKYIFDISYNYQVYESTPEFTYNNWWYPIIEYHLDNSPDFNATTQEQFDTIAQDKSHFIKYFINKVKELIAEQQ
jgi:hypothetical protein